MDAPQGQHIELPAELWDITIDMLRADTRTLKSCSLVCREWTHRAQHRLFNLLSHTWPRPRGGREPAERTAPGTQEELTSFLYASPHIARHVITFVLDSDAPGCYRTLSIPKLSAILSCFPALRKLELRSVEILDEPFRNIAGDRRISPLCHSVGLLKSLSLRRCRVITLLALYGFLTLFPSITYLALVDVKMNLSAFDEAGTSSLLATKLIPSGLALKTLHITYAPRSLLSALIRDIKSMAQTITSLHLSVGVVSEPLGVGPLLAAMPSLRRVQLGSFGKRHLKIAQDGKQAVELRLLPHADNIINRSLWTESRAVQGPEARDILSRQCHSARCPLLAHGLGSAGLRPRDAVLRPDIRACPLQLQRSASLVGPSRREDGSLPAEGPLSTPDAVHQITPRSQRGFGAVIVTAGGCWRCAPGGPSKRTSRASHCSAG